MIPQETTDYLLKIVWQNISNSYNNIAAEYQMTQSIGYLLINIEDEGTAVSALANLLGVKTTSLSRILSSLEQIGYIFRKVSTEDKRSVMIHLSELGKEKRKEAKKVVKAFNEHLDSRLTLKEKQQLHATLQKINKITLAYKPKKNETNY